MYIQYKSARQLDTILELYKQITNYKAHGYLIFVASLGVTFSIFFIVLPTLSSASLYIPYEISSLLLYNEHRSKLPYTEHKLG